MSSHRMPDPSPPSPPPAAAREVAVEIIRTLRHAGHEAYLAGGCVRDELLGLPASDYDVATDATPDRIRSLFRRTAAVGASFGVILVKDAGQVVEVATFRADGSYSDSRRPDSVRFSTPEEDARRRDFTVNALFLDPLEPPNSSTRVIDFVGGLPDLHARVLRAVGDPDRRLAEDHLRALRAARLAGRLDFRVDPATADAIRRHAAELRGVSRERIGDELRTIHASAGRLRGLTLMHDLALDAAVLDEKPLAPSLDHVRALSPDSPFSAMLAALALDRSSPALPDAALASRYRRALCLSNDEHLDLARILSHSATLREDWLTLETPRQKRIAADSRFRWALELLRVRHPDLATRAQDRLAVLESDGIGLAPPPLLTGDDLITLGAKPGPVFKAVLDDLYDAQLRGDLHDRATALELARRRLV